MNKFEIALWKQNVSDRLFGICLLKQQGKHISEVYIKDMTYSPDVLRKTFYCKSDELKPYIALRIRRRQASMDCYLFQRNLLLAGYNKRDIEDIINQYKIKYSRSFSLRSSRLEDFDICNTSNGYTINMKPIEEIFSKSETHIKEV